MLFSDHALESAGYVAKVTEYLQESTTDNVIVESFLDIEADPGFPTILRGLECMRGFAPDTIIALGGGSVMDAAKVMRLLLNHPEANNISHLKLRFMDITKRVSPFPSSVGHAVHHLKGPDTWVRDVDL